jgi:hypothetical protein
MRWALPSVPLSVTVLFFRVVAPTNRLLVAGDVRRPWIIGRGRFQTLIAPTTARIHVQSVPCRRGTTHSWSGGYRECLDVTDRSSDEELIDVTSGDGQTAAGQASAGNEGADQAKAKTSELADQAKQRLGQLQEKAGPYLDKAKERAGDLKEKAGPAASQAAGKAGELAGKAGGAAAHGVESASGALDKATGGKYSDKIKSVSEKLSQMLERGHNHDDKPDIKPSGQE